MLVIDQMLYDYRYIYNLFFWDNETPLFPHMPFGNPSFIDHPIGGPESDLIFDDIEKVINFLKCINPRLIIFSPALKNERWDIHKSRLTSLYEPLFVKDQLFFDLSSTPTIGIIGYPLSECIMMVVNHK